MGDYLVEGTCLFLFYDLFDVEDAEFEGSRSVEDFDRVAGLYGSGGLCGFAVEEYLIRAAGFLSDGAAFEDSGNFQKFVDSHRNLTCFVPFEK